MIIFFGVMWLTINQIDFIGLTLSERHACVLQSEIRNMTIECRRVGGINLAQGVCNTPVPEVVLEGAAEAIGQGRRWFVFVLPKRMLCSTRPFVVFSFLPELLT
ncbi:MAG: hypothetical protein WCI01_04380 [Chlorobiaceae bacterium]